MKSFCYNCAIIFLILKKKEILKNRNHILLIFLLGFWWVLFSFSVLVGIWCNFPEFCAPSVAALLNTQTSHLTEWEGEAELQNMTSYLILVGEEKEEEDPQCGSELPPELCPGQTPSLLEREAIVTHHCKVMQWWILKILQKNFP